MKYEIIPSILVETADEFVERIELCEDFAETVHWDIMDGQFVENMTFADLDVLKNVDTTLTLGVHLMVETPEEMLQGLAKAGIDRVVVHVESTDDLGALLKRMQEFDFETGVALNPETPIGEIDDYMDLVDFVTIMTVVPGASGQYMLADQLEKVRELRALHPELNIAVDGGVNLSTIHQAKEAGANIFGVNSAIFETPDSANAFEVLKAMVENS